MPCYNPIPAWYGDRLENGKREILFSPSGTHSTTGTKIDLPCGKCIGCDLDKTRDWAGRIMNENQMHDESCFITLTYDDENLPVNGSLDKKHFQDFIKRVRERYDDKKIRYFHCGEYGESFNRPHYHAILFGHDFSNDGSNEILHSSNNKIVSSKELSKLWTKGFNTVGKVTYQSASYVAGYVIKKVTGKKSKEHYLRPNRITGEIRPVLPEYVTMSRRPGIGREFFEKYKDEIYSNDSIIMQEMALKPPRYYDKLFANNNPEEFKEIVERRIEKQIGNPDNEWERLKVRERCAEKKVEMKERKFENG